MNDSLAQLVEQLTLNQWVEGSNPSGVTKGGRNSTLFCCLSAGSAVSLFLNTDFFGQRIIPVGRTSRSGCAAVIWHHLDGDAVIDMRL